ncbi:MAG: diaminopimelate epimerase, partial [Muribaculaceae bacterium]|nr:diaminopimelate epimerase [Muribaculaceae bacterium]
TIPVVLAEGQSNKEIPGTLKSGVEVRLTAVSMGNPHGVMFVDDLSQTDVHGVGAELERHPIWPDRSNIEFAEVKSADEVVMRVWERGSGETMACGTGACATAVAAALTGRTGRAVTVRLLGGDLKIEWDEKTNHVFMSGPASTVFLGEVILDK